MSFHIKKNSGVILQETRSSISMRYKTITQAVNQEFWNSKSDTEHSLYVGSYGRGTAIKSSDIDILIELPEEEYERYDSYKTNGQSQLLQTVKSAIQEPYPCTDVRADGQVVKVTFSDGMKLEVLPAFASIDWMGRTIYQYPDTNMGGNWCSTNPKAEQEAMRKKDISSRHLLFDTCKHIRSIRDKYYSSYHLSGILIDSFVYWAIGDWSWTENSSPSAVSEGRFEQTLYDNFVTHYKYVSMIHAPGSFEGVSVSESQECLEKVLAKMLQ
ncbi:MAG: nucleotidyltransferase domain-containing protein [Thermoguttaceae bacterium]|nr:nucleotidyltransferase domain-containing protein [Thermoguttaceae bacterium]